MLFKQGSEEEIDALHQKFFEAFDCTLVRDDLYQCAEIDEATNAYEELADCLKNLGTARITDDAIEIVRDQWKLPWLWLSIELLIHFCYGAYGFANGLIMRHNFWVEYPRPKAPPVTATFSTREGETLDEAAQRLCDTFVDTMSQLAEAHEQQLKEVPMGRFPSQETEVRIQRNVHWLYRNHFCEVSIRALAREYHEQVHPERDFSACDDRKTIRDGIKEAFRLLSLTQYTFLEEGPLGK